MDNNVTLESLLDAPGPSLVASDAVTKFKKPNDTAAKAENFIDNPSVILEASLELVRLLMQQDTYKNFIYPLNELNLLSQTKASFPAEMEYFSMSEIEKSVLKGRFSTVEEVYKAITLLLNSYQDFCPISSQMSQEASRLESIADRWFVNLPEEIKQQSKSCQKFGEKREATDDCLRILNPYNNGIVSDKERIRTIGEEVGPLKTGTGLAPHGGYREDHRNKITPYTYLDYGPYTSFGPCYDSGASHCTRETNDLVLGTFWLPARLLHCDLPADFKSLDNSDYWDDHVDWDLVRNPVESLLHQTAQDPQLNSILKTLDEELKQGLNYTRELDEIIHFQSATDEQDNFNLYLANALTRDSIRTSRLAEPPTKKPRPSSSDDNKVAEALEASSKSLKELYNAQYRRLADSTASLKCLKATTEEYQKAIELSNQLVELCSQTQPRQVVPVPGVRQALGLSPGLPLEAP
ncbi:hypothetical protein Ciccas_003091 [Cichlidogyrus casuarinus]|uniref:Bromo domain-containing protein n=1 Tax=Cichlidogyrus casuarinus TaxID=1844966 RepID=A0ABD2QFD2_9PLAT